MAQQFMKRCRPWEGSTLEKFKEDCVCGWDPMLEQGECETAMQAVGKAAGPNLTQFWCPIAPYTTLPLLS